MRGSRRRRSRPGAAGAAAAAVLTVLGAAGGGELAGPPGGWRPAALQDLLPGFSAPCSVQRVARRELSVENFRAFFRNSQPVIVTGLDNGAMAAASARGELSREYGDVNVTLSSSNQYAQGKVKARLRDYLDRMAPLAGDAKANESLYLFGPNSELGDALAPLLDLYENPYTEAERTLSFGVGASGSGVPFHIHDDGWCEVLWGKKMWALAPPNLPPQFHANESSLAWTRDRFPRLGFAERDALQTCVIGPGEALYFPSMWWHMTLNVGETVSVSAFNHGGRDPPLLRGAAPRGGGGEWGKEF